MIKHITFHYFHNSDDRTTINWGELRVSPRVRGIPADYNYDIILTCGIKNNQAIGNPVTIHNISSTCNLQEIKQKIRHKEPNAVIDAGLFWLKKTGKACQSQLLDDDDLTKAKQEFTLKGTGQIKDMRLAVHVLGDGDKASASQKAVKRRLKVSKEKDDRDSSYDETVLAEYFTENMNDSKKKALNSKFNTCMVELIRYLEQKGSRYRYNLKHLNLWTQLIVDGQLVGPTEEPKWDAYSQQLGNILPLSPLSVKPNRSSSTITQSTPPTAIQDFLSFFTIQHQARDEEDRRRQSLEERRMEE